MSSSRFLERRKDIRDTAPWSVFSYHNRKLRALVRTIIEGAELPPRATVLDYGCAEGPYRTELPPSAEYIGADIEGNQWAQLILRPDGSIPLPDGNIDLVLSTQVLEHVEDPVLYLQESFRVLRPGGRLVLTTHGIMYYHRDPVDHWRWTQTGLAKIVQAAGFRVEEMHGMMGLVPAALQLIQDGTIFYLRGPLRFLRPVYALVMQTAIAIFDHLYNDLERIDNGFVLAIVASKPSA